MSSKKSFDNNLRRIKNVLLKRKNVSRKQRNVFLKKENNWMRKRVHGKLIKCCAKRRKKNEKGKCKTQIPELFFLLCSAC